MRKREKVSRCPKCKKRGSIHLKEVWNEQGKRYKYFYCAHFSKPKGKRKISWCYLGKSPRGSKRRRA